MNNLKTMVVIFGCALAAACASPMNHYTNTLAEGGVETIAGVAGSPDVPSNGQLDHPPEMIQLGHIAYPTWAALQRVCGTITVDALINRFGKAVQTRIESRKFNTDGVVDESGGGGKFRYTIAEVFDAPAIDFVRTSKYQPARKNKEAIDEWVRIPVIFPNEAGDKCAKQ